MQLPRSYVHTSSLCHLYQQHHVILSPSPWCWDHEDGEFGWTSSMLSQWLWQGAGERRGNRDVPHSSSKMSLCCVSFTCCQQHHLTSWETPLRCVEWQHVFLRIPCWGQGRASAFKCRLVPINLSCQLPIRNRKDSGQTITAGNIQLTQAKVQGMRWIDLVCRWKQERSLCWKLMSLLHELFLFNWKILFCHKWSLVVVYLTPQNYRWNTNRVTCARSQPAFSLPMSPSHYQWCLQGNSAQLRGPMLRVLGCLRPLQGSQANLQTWEPHLGHMGYSTRNKNFF